MLLFLCDGIDLTGDPNIGISHECDNISETLEPCRFSIVIAAWAVGGNVRLYGVYRIVKNVGSKKVWRIRTVGRLAEKTLANEIHLHRECFGNSENWQKNVATAVICQICQSFYCMVNN